MSQENPNDQENIPTTQAPKEKQTNTLVSVGLFIWDLAKVIIISLIIIVPLRYYVAQPFIVSGSSMEPTFHNNEYLIINELSYHLSAPQRGDVIVFKYPKNTSEYFIKRIIGLPGEKVQITSGHVEIYNNQHPDGVSLDESYLPAGLTTAGSDQIITLSSDEYYVLGDNRSASSDSRFWGTVPKNDIIGKVFIRAYPVQNFKKFSTVQYNY